MEPIVAAVQEGQREGISVGVAGSDSPHTEKGKAVGAERMIQMLVCGQVGHLSPGTGRVALAQSCGENGGRLALTSHYELEAVLSMWPVPNSSRPFIGVDGGQTVVEVRRPTYVTTALSESGAVSLKHGNFGIAC